MAGEALRTAVHQNGDDDVEDDEHHEIEIDIKVADGDDVAEDIFRVETHLESDELVVADLQGRGGLTVPRVAIGC